MNRKSPSSDHASDLQESLRLNVELETKRRAVVARIVELEPSGPPVAETTAVSNLRGRIAELLNGAAPRNLFGGKNPANELHGLLAVELPAITGAIELNRREMIRLGGVHAEAVMTDKAADWRALNRERTFAIARLLAAFRRCDAMQAEFQQASQGAIAIIGMNLQFAFRHGQQPKTAVDIFEMAIAQGWCSRSEIEKELL